MRSVITSVRDTAGIRVRRLGCKILSRCSLTVPALYLRDLDEGRCLLKFHNLRASLASPSSRPRPGSFGGMIKRYTLLGQILSLLNIWDGEGGGGQECPF